MKKFAKTSASLMLLAFALSGCFYPGYGYGHGGGWGNGGGWDGGYHNGGGGYHNGYDH